MMLLLPTITEAWNNLIMFCEFVFFHSADSVLDDPM